MKVLIVHCHPEPASFNAVLTNTAIEKLEQDGHEVVVSDLYAEEFNPVEGPGRYTSRRHSSYFQALDEQRWHYESDALAGDVSREIARLEWAQTIIFQCPLWWHGVPAMLKGWFDRVFVYGGLYTGSQRFDRGFLKGRRALFCVTTGAPETTFAPLGRSGDIAALMWPLHCSLYYVGLSVLPPHLVYGVQGGGLSYQQDESFRAHLDMAKTYWAERLATLEQDTPIPMSGWEDWDEAGILKSDHPLRWRV
ncbi:NAD(P)H-dependent oxidoreductase [Kushneria phyllosphaerae]|uniref:General stress protein 14 n=1 Tax=Kushneria phyllosphaerae TaxID=2100822 RepID=A0A2R8CQ91_9GAMM|nr:NAD(P)H-dependent oxidoreductase [Kushneria phyllosphaerae]SPJ34973.1 General stress protein 14 [Kushneria phyllosphaerae]